MKRQVIFLFAILISCLAFAQNGKGNKAKERTPEQIAEARTKRWTKALTLTPEQVPQVKAIIQEKIEKIKDARTQNAKATDKKAMHQQIKTIRTEADAKMKGVLTQEQYDLYVKIKEENRKKAEKAKTQDIEGDDDF